MKILTLILLLLFVSAHAQPPEVNAARTFRQAHEHEIMEEFTKLLAIPNVASDTANIRRNADLISEMLAKRGIKTQLLTVPDVPPVVYGEIKTPGATRTLIIYVPYYSVIKNS